MKSLGLSPAAETDPVRIWRHSAEHWGPDQADRYTDDIRHVCQGLAIGTRRGLSVDVRQGYLKCVIGAHMIYFRDHADRVEVDRILHQRQDISRNLPG